MIFTEKCQNCFQVQSQQCVCFFLSSNKMHSLLVHFFWNKSFMLLLFLKVPITYFSNYGTLFFCLKSVLSVDEMVSMLIALFFVVMLKWFCFM